jgi:hypothetical protein
MRIVDNQLDHDRLINNPIYRLTGCMETTRFFSNLASACVKFGYHVEDRIFEHIQNVNLPKLDYIGQHTVFGPEERYILIKPKFGSEVPDVVLVDGSNINVYEIKVNLRSSDSKKAHGERVKYERLKEYLLNNHPSYATNVFAVDFLGGGGGATALYEKADVFQVIDGESFCNTMGIDYQDVIDDLEKDREYNQEFIKDYMISMWEKP